MMNLLKWFAKILRVLAWGVILIGLVLLVKMGLSKEQDIFMKAVASDNLIQVRVLVAIDPSLIKLNAEGIYREPYDGIPGNNVHETEAHPLYWAVKEGSQKVARFLISKGADVNCKNSYNGATPLYEAAFYAKKDLVGMLISKGLMSMSL